MTKAYNLVNFKFGFEYETIVQVKSANFYKLFQNTFDNCSRNSISQNIFNRYQLANIYNTAERPFSYTVAYHGRPCKLRPILLDTNNDTHMAGTELSKPWVVTHDGSVKSENESHGNIIQYIEIVSPILSWADITSNILETVLNKQLLCDVEFNYFNNSTTSNHVHLSYNKVFQDKDAKIVLKIAMAWWYFEHVFLYLVDYSRRDNHFCETIHSYFKSRGFNSDLVKETFKKLQDDNLQAFLNFVFKDNVHKISSNLDGLVSFFQGGSRYLAFNMLNLLKYGTIEIRLKHGSSDMNENTKYVKLLTYFFKAAMEMPCINTIENINEENYWVFNENIHNLIHNKENLLNKSNVLNEKFNEMFNFIVSKTEVTDEKNEINEINELYNYWKTILNKNIAIDPYPNAHGGGKVLYLLSYGSNSIEQLSRRIGHIGPMNHKPAYIQDYARIFAGYSSRWKGAIASIHKAKGKRVYGTLVEITNDELEKLDVFEGGYSREIMQVINQENMNIVDAFVYVKNKTDFNRLPSESYMQAIHKQLHDSVRYHKHTIMIRVIINGKLQTIGKWSPNNGFQM